MTDIGEIVIDISLDTTGDTLYAPSGQIFKTLVFGVGYDGNNTAMQLYQASPELQYDIVKRSTSLGGNVTGSFIGDYAVGSVANNNPYYFDDSLGITLSEVLLTTIPIILMIHLESDWKVLLVA